MCLSTNKVGLQYLPSVMNHFVSLYSFKCKDKIGKYFLTSTVVIFYFNEGMMFNLK